MKLYCVFICLILTYNLPAQKTSLSDMLWEQVDARFTTMDENKAARTSVTDAVAKGYLKIYYEEEGCGCPFETTVAGYKHANGHYTTLKLYYDGCGWEKSMSSNRVLDSVLPKDFGLHSFLPKLQETDLQATSALFYLEPEIPRNGTDTKVELAYIPFGINMGSENGLLRFGYKQLTDEDGTNYTYSGELSAMLHAITDKNTLHFILEGTTDSIAPKDKRVVENLFGKNKRYNGFNELTAEIRELHSIYELSKTIEYKSVILGWNRKEARFYIKRKLKNHSPELSFLEFVRQLPFLMAVC